MHADVLYVNSSLANTRRTLDFIYDRSRRRMGEHFLPLLVFFTNSILRMLVFLAVVGVITNDMHAMGLVLYLFMPARQLQVITMHQVYSKNTNRATGSLHKHIALEETCKRRTPNALDKAYHQSKSTKIIL